MSRSRPDRGVALIAVLFLAAVLTLLMYAFLREMEVEASLAASYGREKQAEQLAWGAIEKGMATVATDTQLHASPTSPWLDNPTEFYEVELGEGVYSLYRAPMDDDAETRPKWGLMDEASKINVNVAPRNILMRLPGMTDEIADSILDWRDEDDEVTNQGAENAYYQGLQPPYACKNAAFSTIDELLLVKGMTPELLYGEDANQNGRLDAAENDGEENDPVDNQDGLLDRGIASYITVWSTDRNIRADNGEKRLNLNTATPQQLQETLGDVLSNQELNNIQIRRLRFQPPGVYPSIAHLMDVQGVQPAGISKEKFIRICDRLTLLDDEVVPGLLNVNTAPKKALEMLPGLTPEDVALLIQHRTSPDADLSNIGWVTVLPTPKVQQIVNFITVRSWQFRLDAVARMGPKSELAEDALLTQEPSESDPAAPARVYKRILAVWDRAATPPRLVWWKDVSRLGAPYSVLEPAP